MENLLEKVTEFVSESFARVGKSQNTKHLERTAYWLKQLKPDADEAMLIAAISHDIERAFRQEDMEELKKSVGTLDKEFLSRHQERSANIMAEFLEKCGADKELITKIERLITHHEKGGDEEQNLLKDADSISFFENNIPTFLTKAVAEIGKEEVRKKFDWMFERITSPEAKEMVKEWNAKAVEGLGN